MRTSAERVANRIVLVGVLAAGAWGCGDASPTQGGATGDESGPCYPNDTCNAGLECSGGVCVVEEIEFGAIGWPCDETWVDPGCDPGLVCFGGVCDEPYDLDGLDRVPENFARIEPGTFTMGSPSGELGHQDDEAEHTVTLTRPFAIQVTEVTQEQYVLLMGDNPSEFTACAPCPVESVNWFDAVEYANALSRSERLPECYDADGRVIGGATVYDCVGYRLPTEAEWEYAARAGTSTATYAGDLSDEACEDRTLLSIAWFCGNAPDAVYAAGSKSPNAWGLYDMLGNAWEWTNDWYEGYLGAVTDPSSSVTGRYRVLRGGAAYDEALFSRAAYRLPTVPEIRNAFGTGFRVVRTLPSGPARSAP